MTSGGARRKWGAARPSRPPGGLQLCGGRAAGFRGPFEGIGEKERVSGWDLVGTAPGRKRLTGDCKRKIEIEIAIELSAASRS